MPLRIADRKDVDQRNVGCAVFARSPLFPGYGLARLEDVFARSGCTGNLLGKKEEIESLSDRFPGCVAVYFLGSRIPADYSQLRGNREYDVLGAVDDGHQGRLFALKPDHVADVTADCCARAYASRRVTSPQHADQVSHRFALL